MSIIVKDSGGNFERPLPGMHHGVCSNIYGPFRSTYMYQGKEVSADKVIIMFELEERLSKGDFANCRFTQSQTFTASLSEKSKLRPFLESWRGMPFTEEQAKGFDLEKLIGVNCNLNLIEKPRQGGGSSIVIVGIVPPIKGQEALKTELPRDYVPEWILKKIVGVVAPETHEGSGVENETIPF